MLAEFARSGSERAFAALVERHLPLVHSVARRHTADPQQAQDIAQTVFVLLARKAGTLGRTCVLPGWLYHTARLTAANVQRADTRRLRREQEAFMQTIPTEPESGHVWRELGPRLEEAMAALGDGDRDALVLRYFQNRSMAEVASALGWTENTAQKRVGRALDKLRKNFARKGIVLTTTAIAGTLAANAVQAAPTGLATTISTGALAGAATTTTAFAAATKAIAMTTLQKITVTAALTVTVGAGLYEAGQAASARAEARTLREQQAPLNDRIAQLERERDDATNRLARLTAPSRRDGNSAELLKLRGEVTQLRSAARESDDPIVRQALAWKTNVEKMKQLFAEHPEQRVPEMRLLSDQRFFDLARDQDLDSSNGIRRAFSEIRKDAKNAFVPMLQQALNAFINANNGQLPAQASDLKSYFEQPVDDDMLAQYKMLFTGSAADVKGNFVMEDRQVIDPEYDYPWQIGPNAYGPDASALESAQTKANVQTLAPAITAFAAANGGSEPSNLGQLKPYVTTPDQQAAYDNLAKGAVSFGHGAGQ